MKKTNCLLIASLISCNMFCQLPYSSVAIANDGEEKPLVYSADGRYAVSLVEELAEGSSRFVLWDLLAGKLLYTLILRDATAAGALFSADGELVVISSEDNLECWSVYDHSLKWKRKAKSYCAYEKDKILLTDYENDQMSLVSHSFLNGDSLKTILKLPFFVRTCRSSPGGEFLELVRTSYSSAKDSILLLKAATGRRLYSIGIEDREKSILFSPGDKYLVLPEYAEVLCVLDTKDFDTVFTYQFGNIASVKFSTDDRYLLVNHKVDGVLNTLTVVDMESRQVIDSSTWNDHFLGGLFSASDSEIVVVTDSIFTYNFFTKEKTAQRPFASETGVTGIAVHNNVLHIQSAHKITTRIALADLRELTPLQTMLTPVLKARFTDSAHFITWNDHNIKNGTPEWMEDWVGYIFQNYFARYDLMEATTTKYVPDKGESATRVTVSNNGRNVLYGLGDSRMSICDSRTGRIVSKFTIDTAFDYYGYRFSADNSNLIYKKLSKDRSAHLFSIEVRNVATGKLRTSLKSPTGADLFHISPDGKYVIVVFTDPKLKDGAIGRHFQVINVSSGKAIFTAANLEIAEGEYSSSEGRELIANNIFFAFENDTLKKFVIAGDTVKKTLYVPTIATGTELFVKSPYIIAKSAKYLLTRSDDTLYVWNVLDGALIDTLIFPGNVDQEAFSEDEQYVYLLGTDNDRIVLAKWAFQWKSKLVSKFTNALDLWGNRVAFNSFSLSPDGIHAIASNTNHTLIAFDCSKQSILYYMQPVNRNDQLVFKPPFKK